jgi:biotin carboxylase
MSTAKTILILGGGTMQIPAIRLAKAKAWNVIVVDGNPRAEGKALAEYFEHIDIKDKEEIARRAAIYKKRIGLDGVFTAGTDFSTTVAFVAGELGLPGISYETACNATDKSRMRSIFMEKGVPSPQFLSLCTDDDPLSISAQLRFPLVIKPVDNMGARGVVRVDNEHELAESFRSAIALSKSGRIIAEEYLEGPELSIDALVWKGEITICGVADRHIFFPPHFVEMGHTLPTNLPADQANDAIEVFKRGVRALGIDIGAAKGDIKITSKGAIIGEIAARLSGGYMSGWTYPYSTGTEVTDAALNIAVGEEPGNLAPKKNDVSAERAFISIPGKIRCITGFENVIKMPKIVAGFIRVAPGADITFPKNNVEKCGNVIACDSMRENAIASAEKAISSIMIRLEPDVAKTDRFLFNNAANGDKSAAAAYELKDERNMNAITNMRWYTVNSPNKGMSTISILTLPFFENETANDWHGKNINAAFSELIFLSGVTIDSDGRQTHISLGKIFWKAFLRGGIQAGFYIIDTIRCFIDKNENLPEKLNRWIS